MRLYTSLGKPLWCQTPELLIRIVGFLIDTETINLLLNGRFSVHEHVAETWGKSTVIVPVVFMSIIFIEGTSVRIDGKA